MKKIKIEIVSKKIGIFEYKILLENEHYYIIWQDSDTEQITLYDKDNNEISTILNCFGSYPPGIKSIYELIIRDIRNRGYGDCYIENPPKWIIS